MAVTDTNAIERLKLDYEAALFPNRETPKPLAIVRALDLRAALDERDDLIAVVRDMHAHLRYNFLSVTREATPSYTCRICQCVFFDAAHPPSPCVMSRAETLLARLDKAVSA